MNDDDVYFKKYTPEREVDKLIKERKTSTIPAEDRVRIANQIKNNPPEPGFMRVDVGPGIYSIDLNNDSNWWFNHECTVFPLLLDQGIRTHVDIKDSFKPEKRLPDFNYIWIIVLIAGLAMILLFGNMLFGIF